MSHFFSRQCEYAIQGVLYIALKPQGEMTSVRELADGLSIPYHFLAKILRSLKQKGLLDSLKGPSGGFALGLPAKTITLLDVVEAIDGPVFSRRCVLGFTRCSPAYPCAAHDQWEISRDGIFHMLAMKNVAEVAQDMCTISAGTNRQRLSFFCVPNKDKKV